MKFLTLLLALGLVYAGPSLADDSVTTAETKVAIDYLKVISRGNVDISKHTALSEHCGIQRRKEIRERLEFLQKNYFRKGDSYTVESNKSEGNLAAILVRADNPAAPLSTRIHAIALIKKNDTWKAAPLPGSFTNTGYGYDPKVELTVRSLERWMAREKILREARCRKKATSEFKSTIAAVEKKAGFDAMDPEEAIGNLLKQCREKNVLGILACMGAASDQLVDPMETTLDLISKGLANEDPKNDWHLVTSRSVIAQVLKIDNTRNEIALGFFNPLERNKSKVLYFPIHKSGDKTFVRLSPMLKIAMLPNNERWQQRWKHRRGDEDKLRKTLPATIFKNNPPVSYPTSAKLLEHFLEALKKDDFTDSIHLLPRKGDYFGKEENQSSCLLGLGSLWREIHRLEINPRHSFGTLEEKSVGLAPLQYAKTNRPGEYQTIKVWMIKDDDGWHLAGRNSLDAMEDQTLVKAMAKLEKRLSSMEKEQQDKHSRDLLNEVVTLTPPIALDPVKEEDANKLFTDFRAHLRAKNIKAALSCCAVLKGTNSTQTLKTFDYAIRGASDHINDDQILGTTRAGKWMGISVRTKSKLIDLHDYPLYIIANTEKGPRILLDIDLRYATNKGRKLLNKKNWIKLEKALPKESFEHIQTLFAKHSELTVADIKAEKKLHE